MKIVVNPARKVSAQTTSPKGPNAVRLRPDMVGIDNIWL
jgi:hypothetical protein